MNLDETKYKGENPYGFGYTHLLEKKEAKMLHYILERFARSARWEYKIRQHIQDPIAEKSDLIKLKGLQLKSLYEFCLGMDNSE